MTTAAGVIIGNEILTGKFADENGPFLIRRLRDLGTDLVRLATIPDELDVIAAEVAAASRAADHVFTSGGVGPTHDDLTLEGVGRAFGLPMVRQPALVELLEAFDMPIDDATLRMATVPEGTELLAGQKLAYPVLRVRNVFVLPGVPKLFRMKFELVADRVAGEAVHTARVYTDEYETAIATRLGAVDAAHPAVDIGSYPRFGEGDYRVIITLESRDPAALELAHAAVEAAVRVVVPGQ